MMAISRYIYVTIFVGSIISFSLREAFIVSYYQFNKAMIIELFCINKDKVELTCNGKCHLKTLLEESKPDAEYPIPIPSLEDKLPFTVDLNVIVKSGLLKLEDYLNHSLYYKLNYSYFPFFTIFHPPKRA